MSIPEEKVTIEDKTISIENKQVIETSSIINEPTSPIENEIEDESVGEGTDIQTIQTDNFWGGLFRGTTHKLLESFTSVKVWFFIWPFCLSGFILYMYVYKILENIDIVLSKTLDEPTYHFVIKSLDKLNDAFAGWLGFIVALVGSIIVVRETFKIGKVNILAKTNQIEEAKKIQS